jgi:phage host-nuclease inhibitor protein Gam
MAKTIEKQAIEKLDNLAEAEYMVSVVNMDIAKMREEAMTPELRAELDAIEADIEAEYGDKLKHAKSVIQTLQEDIKKLVLRQGETVKGGHKMATYNKGRVVWNDDALMGYAVEHPEILKFRKVNDPSVSFRQVAAK